MKKFNVQNERNLTMLMDFYELTMSNGYFKSNNKDTLVCFDMFFRKCPDGGGFVIAAGLEQLIEYIENLRFTEEDINYLRGRDLFEEEFLEYLKNFKFTGNISAIPEGTPVFPGEAMVTVTAKAIEAQFIETMLLLTINHQSLIATKTNRIVRASKGRTVFELGARRAHGYDAAIYGARAAYIGGIDGTATTIADMEFNVPAIGTMAHSWVQFFKSEYEAFKTYANTYPDNCTLLVDTYDVLHSGVPNAIRVHKEVLEPINKKLKGIRLDSGDLAYLSIKVRKMLDEAGLNDCQIVASNSLDEYTIESLLNQEAEIDIFGVGERLITAKSEPVFGGVYKLVAVEENGEMVPRIKISENIEKITNPGSKETWRLYDRDTNMAIADVITLKNEVIDDTKPYNIFDQVHIWKSKNVENFYAKKIQEPIYVDGKLVYKCPSLKEIRNYCKNEVNTLWDEIKRFSNPHKYYVDLSSDLWFLKKSMLEKIKAEN